ncbi:ATP-binding protein, partial [bacterium]|nr:ATP-binding protein [bacterium]
MAYLALYRKYRPELFSEVIGQEHVKRTLKNAIKLDQISHAYLFSGPRGTGKTTVARIMARAVNCTDLQDGEPCGKCDNCKSISSGAWGVVEIDG